MPLQKPGISRSLPPPRGAAISGILFSLLLGATLVIIRLAIPASDRNTIALFQDPVRRTAVRTAIHLAPFAGVAFLWFIGVLRNRLGPLEDQFFATVFLGSGLLFVGSLFASAALAGALLETVAHANDHPLNPEAIYLARRMAGASLNIFGIRMAAVFTFSTSTVILRTSILPRWVALAGFGCATVLLLVITNWPWIALLFPAWILLVSVCILIHELGWDR